MPLRYGQVPRPHERQPVVDRDAVVLVDDVVPGVKNEDNEYHYRYVHGMGEYHSYSDRFIGWVVERHRQEPDIISGNYDIHWLEKWLDRKFAKPA